MKKKTPAFAVLGLAASLLASPLSAQITEYVALGDSLTAGFQSNCLVQRNQLNSFPAVIARTLGIADFQQPLVQEVPITTPLVPPNSCLGPAIVGGAITVVPVSTMGQPLNALLPRPYDNLGLPGFNAADLTQIKHGNPAGSGKEQTAALILRNIPGFPLDGTSAVDQADILLGPASGPTLVSLWIGNNDVLGAATSGIVVDGVTLTTAADFEAAYTAIMDGLLPSTRLVGANVPDVTAIPFTSTIPPVLVDPATMQPVLIGGQPVPLLGPGDAANPCVPTPPDLGCPLPPGTLVNLPASSLLAPPLLLGIPKAAGGSGLPLPHGSIDAMGAHPGVLLYPDEVALLRSRTDEYNATIAEQIGAAGGALWDTHGFFADVAAHGYTIGGVTVTTSFVKGGIFSYDGVHPSNIGYAVVADQLIQTLNAQGPDVFPRPDVASALFTPNVSPFAPSAPASVERGGAWEYTFSTWQGVLDRFASSLGPMALPEIPRAAPPTRPGRTTRSVSRPGVDR
jgi:lysophospholipase L1-like esterase